MAIFDNNDNFNFDDRIVSSNAKDYEMSTEISLRPGAGSRE